jgi:hypothetical protein
MGAGLLSVLSMGGLVTGCGDDTAPTASKKKAERGKVKKGDKAARGDKGAKSDAGKGAKSAGQTQKAGPKEPVPSLLVVQAQFTKKDGRPKPLPAKMVLFRYSEGEYFREELEDPDSNVFHKAMAFDNGILTIGAMGALLKHWTRDGDGWKAETLWERSWGGRFDRLRDLEIGDVNGDGQDELVLATHHQGVVAVGTKTDGKWVFVEMDQKADTFVHEIEIGDVDGDGLKEFYATPSDRNRASGESQPGSVYRYDFVDGAYVSSTVVAFTESHAKEILVTDIDGDGTDELYVVREAHTKKTDAGVERVDPVRIVRFTKDGDKWTDTVASTLDDDQCRFLLAGDVDGDGKTELVAAAEHTGLWMLKQAEGGTFDQVLIDANSGGFEHATHTADLDRDGKLEIYVAADNQKEFRQYTWTGEGFDRKKVDIIGPRENSFITWNIQDGVF